MAQSTATRDIALNVIGRIDEYQKALSKLPGITEKKAAQAALKMQQVFTKAAVDQAEAEKKAANQSVANWRSAIDAIGAYFTVKGLGDIAKRAAGMKSEISGVIMEISKFSDITGLSAETINGLRFAFESTGNESNKLESALENLPERLSQFATGSGEAKNVLEQLGYTSEDVGMMLHDTDGFFRDFLNRLRNVESDAQRAGLAAQMFGDAGAYLTSALKTKDLDEWIKTARVGVDVSKENVEAAQDWTATLNVLSAAWERSMQQLTGLVDLNYIARQFGTVAVASFTGVTSAIKEVTHGWSLLLTAIRLAARGDFDIAKDALTEWWQAGTDMINGNTLGRIANDALEAGRAFNEATLAVNDNTNAYDPLALALQKTSQQRQAEAQAAAKAAAAAAKEAREIEQLHDKRAQYADFLRGVVDEQTTDERKLFNEEQDRFHKLMELQHDGVIGWDEYTQGVIAVEESYNRKMADLTKEKNMDAAMAQHDFQKRVQDEAKEHRDKMKAFAFQIADAFGESFSTIADLVAASTQRQLDSVRAFVDKARNARQQLTDKIKHADTEEEKAAIRQQQAILTATIKANAAKVQIERHHARQAAKLQKAAALYGIGVNAAQAVLMAFALFGPPPSVVGIAAAAAAGVAAGVQAAAVAAEPMPTFFGGTARIGGAGEHSVTLHDGEAVLNARAARDLGPAIIGALNAGLAPLASLGMGQGSVQLDGYLVGRVVASQIRRGGPITDAIRAKSRPRGYVNPYRQR